MIGVKLLLLVGCFVAVFADEPQLESAEQAEVVKVTASSDRDQIQIADPFEFEIIVTAPRGTTVRFPEFEDKIGSFDIVDVKEVKQGKDQDDPQQETWTQKFILETIDSGDFEVPSIEVSVTDEQGSRVLRTEPVSVSVASLVEANADLTKFNDIADLIDVEQPEQSSTKLVWIYSITGFALTLATVCLWLASRPPVFETATAWALGRLEHADGDFLQVEGILREFLEEKLELPATSLGTATLVSELERKRVEQKQITEVKEIFEVSERVKFGGMKLSEQQTARLNNSARDLISQLGEVDFATSDDMEAA